MFAVATAAHAGLAVAMLRAPGPERPRPRPIEIEFRKRVTPPEAPRLTRTRPAVPPPARRPPKVAAVKPPHIPPAERPPPAAPPPPHPSAPRPPVFGVSMESTTAVSSSSFAVPVGGSTMVAPGPSRPGRPLGGVPGATGEGDGYRPVSEVDIKTMPDVDSDACGRTVAYPPDAERNGIAGDVRLRVALDERGHVHNVRVIAGLGHGLDQAAADAIQHHCRFTPAIDRNGRPVAFVIQSYTFHFELPR
jgi:protein TonB